MGILRALSFTVVGPVMVLLKALLWIYCRLWFGNILSPVMGILWVMS